MAECELCGRKIKSHIKARVDGILLNVCSECAKSGKVMETPKPKTPWRVFDQRKIQPEEIIVDDFAQKIRQARQQRNMKQEEVANALNEKLSVISAVENGKRVPNLTFARKLEKFFGIKLIKIE